MGTHGATNHEVVGDTEGDHRLSRRRVPLRLEDHVPRSADDVEPPGCLPGVCFGAFDEDEVVDVGDVPDSPAAGSVRESAGEPEPLVDAGAVAEAHHGVDEVLAVPFDALEVPVHELDGHCAVSRFDVGFGHPDLAGTLVALFNARSYRFISISY